MAAIQKTKQPKKKKVKKEDEVTFAPGVVSEEKKKRLKKLDEFIEGVLQEAGEEFLDEFKQIEGE
ncbi:MAG: hypothetical protein H8E19_16130 [Deltaproteobacteria bacterium]|uniref:Uncharacterized protein n=1 Tax=Candidatus Desulfacyla euxinica TaxID=2841693 RepID=A0A8J6N1Z1_9DELT|nr:hypothetical protein [Candidatus Desulfacyla euxinica]